MCVFKSESMYMYLCVSDCVSLSVYFDSSQSNDT